MAVVVARDGRLPAGADEAVAEAAGGGPGASAPAPEEAAAALVGAGRGLVGADRERSRAGRSRGRLALLLEPVAAGAPAGLARRPGSGAPAGRRPGPAAAGRRGAGRSRDQTATVRAELLRVDGRVVVPVDVPGPAVATLMPGVRSPGPSREPAPATGRTAPSEPPAAATPPQRRSRAELLALIEPDPATMDLADATRVLGGGAGLVPRGAGDQQARAVFALLGRRRGRPGGVGRAPPGSSPTPAGSGHERQIGTTGVAIDPDLYVAFGVSGASQHTGGLGNPRHIVSVNTDPACPMTAMADLGLVDRRHRPAARAGRPARRSRCARPRTGRPRQRRTS